MTQTAKAAAEISGRATGVLFFAGFGAIWMRNGLAAMNQLTPIAMAAIVTLLAVLVIPAVRLISSASRNTAKHDPEPRAREMNRAFYRVNIFQWIAIVAAVVLLNLVHKGEYLAPVISFIVGIHLFPLASLFHYKAHNVTGTLLVVWSIAVAATLPGAAMPSICSVGTAAILLASAAYTLAAAIQVAKRELDADAFSEQIA